jgi:CRP-like cAMP-binding protein
MTQKFEKGAKICKEGEMASAMYIVKNGKLRRSLEGLSIGYFISGDSLE